MDKNSPIVLFDSGVGGLTIAKEVMSEFPNEDIIYFGDTAHLPYGSRPQAEVRKFAFEIIDYFLELEAKMVIIACNTATAAGLKAAKKKFGVSIIGPIQPGVREAILATSNNKIGVIATEGTIGSGAYQRALQTKSADVEVYAQACPKFIPLVEAGELYSQKTKQIAQRYLTSLVKEEIDTLLLGCTHFPYLGKVLQEVVGESVNLIYPGRGIALQVRDILERKALLSPTPTKGKREFYISDLDKLSAKFVRLGKEFLNLKELEFKELDLWSS
ncbi:glutamate racemase [Natroniella sulfidigena]|uniref:glutamate racemase n=1 Tax=Natroniella sulfidigena TaxID=723921 RepID=UPI00200B91D3|nr:glutamate racemase [Natroniella sulfidigena]MCK8817126.1 glutamate racemase [Natroniella sulfidigena]